MQKTLHGSLKSARCQLDLCIIALEQMTVPDSIMHTLEEVCASLHAMEERCEPSQTHAFDEAKKNGQ